MVTKTKESKKYEKNLCNSNAIIEKLCWNLPDWQEAESRGRLGCVSVSAACLCVRTGRRRFAISERITQTKTCNLCSAEVFVMYPNGAYLYFNMSRVTAAVYLALCARFNL